MKVFLTLMAGVTVLVAGAVAQQVQTMSLQQCVQLALEKNVSIIQAQNSVDAAGGKVLAAYGNYLPTLIVSGSWNRSQSDITSSFTSNLGAGASVSNGPSFFVSNEFRTGVSLDYTLFDGFSREAAFNSAKSSAMSTEDKSMRTRQTVTNQVENTYLDILRKEQLVKVSDENLKRDKRQLERITESNKVGAVALADVYRQQSQVASDELLQINAQNAFDKAKADLVALIGMDMMAEYQFADPTIVLSVNQAELDSTQKMYSNLAHLNQRAIDARPDYLAAKEDMRAAESGVTQARSGYFPTIAASAGYGISNNELSRLTDNKNISWGLSMRWNIFDAFRTNQSLQTAMASHKTAEASLLQAERDISVQLKKTLLDLEAAGKQVEVSEKGFLSATEDHKIAEERYNLGAGTLLDLLTANAGLVNAEANVVNATYNYNIAKRNLEYVIGERTY